MKRKLPVYVKRKMLKGIEERGKVKKKDKKNKYFNIIQIKRNPLEETLERLAKHLDEIKRILKELK